MVSSCILLCRADIANTFWPPVHLAPGLLELEVGTEPFASLQERIFFLRASRPTLSFAFFLAHFLRYERGFHDRAIGLQSSSQLNQLRCARSKVVLGQGQPRRG